MNLKFCLFSFYFLFQFYLSKGITFDEVINSVEINSIENEELKQDLKNNLEYLEGKLNFFKNKINKNKALGEKLESAAKKLCNKLKVMVVKSNWDNFSVFLDNGITILKKIYQTMTKEYKDYEKKYYVKALAIISNNWDIFSIIFDLWHQKILFFSQPSVSQPSVSQTSTSQNHSHHRRSKRGYNYYKKTEEEREKEHNEQVNKFNQHVDEAYNFVCLSYVFLNIIMFVVVYLFATQIYRQLH
ncbi:unnamed protein product [Meloidogyne enterolobii]|uniref:Uncharacterized protein n=1 Tax=Meloidogyne enterolobii TaxID=390850 RepID=A0ACB0XV97_MELEN